MSRLTDLMLTALAPVVWGSTYYVTTEWLTGWPPMTLALLRALPAGLLLLALVRRLPTRRQWGPVLLLGTLNFALFWGLLFVAAQRLPGGVAATLGSAQALLVLLLARGWLGAPLSAAAVAAALAGVGGVGLLVLGPAAALDPVGLAAGVGSAVAMAAGTVLSRRWQAGTTPLTFTAWQLTAGGLVLLPLALVLEPAGPALEIRHLGGLVYLGGLGAAVTYWLWFRGIARLGPSVPALLALLSPVAAVVLGWVLLGQGLTVVQAAGMLIVLASVVVGPWVAGPPGRAASASVAPVAAPSAATSRADLTRRATPIG